MGVRKRLPLAVPLILLLVALYTLIRLANLDALVTTDEPLWIGRSANFYRALRAGQLEYTYQAAHPGILTMWTGALAYAIHAPEYTRLAPANLDDVRSIDTALRRVDIDPLSMMVVAKVSLQSLFFSIAMVFCVRMLNAWITLAAGLLIAFDPFLSGLDSTLHVDGLFTIACFAALMSIGYVAGQTTLSTGHLTATLPWAIAGLLSACAWLTRATGVLLIGVVVFSLVLATAASLRNRSDFDPGLQALSFTKHFGVWLIAAMATTIALLPALWVAPFDVAVQFLIWNVRFGAAHENPTFYLGEVHQGDPGFSFYPLARIIHE